MPKILITGGTGFVNSFLAASLLEMGEEIFFLARSSGKYCAARRIQQALQLTGLTTIVANKNYHVIESNLTEKNAGISTVDFNALKREKIDEIIHGAGSVNFSEDKAANTFDVNYNGTKKMLDLARSLNIQCFHYISTAYASPNNNIFDHLRDKQVSNICNFNNQYEYSKSLSATLVQSWGKANNTGVKIYEPSIITGHSATGKAFNFSAFYNCLYFYRFLQEKMAGKNMAAKFKIPGHTAANINLITIDYFIQVFKLVREFGVCGKYKIINENPLSYQELQEMCMSYYGLDNVMISNSSNAYAEFNGQCDRTLSSFLERGMSAYLPYISRSFNFDRSCPNAGTKIDHV